MCLLLVFCSCLLKKKLSYIVLRLVTDLFNLYKLLADEYIEAFTDSILQEQEPEIQLCGTIRIIFWNFSDESEIFAKALATKTDIFGYLANDLKEIYRIEFKTVKVNVIIGIQFSKYFW